MSELVSIIVPVYNMEKLLQKSVESILNQTYKNLEIILVNDGSKDNSATICDEFAKKDSRIRAIHKTNGGVSSTRNRGLDECTGEFVCFVDSDDYLEAGYVQRMYDGMKQSNCEMAACRYNTYGFKKNNLPPKTDDLQLSTEDYLKHLLIETDYGAGFCWNKMFRRNLIGKMRFDESISFGEDLVFVYSYIKKHVKTIYLCNEPLYNYINRVDSLSKVRNESKLFSEVDFCYSLIEDVKSAYPRLVSYAYGRYIRILSLYVVFCTEIKSIKGRIKEARKMYMSAVKMKEYSFKWKYLTFIRLFFPNTIRFLVRSKRKVKELLR